MAAASLRYLMFCILWNIIKLSDPFYNIDNTRISMTLYAFDGTWNDANTLKVTPDVEHLTNVYWFQKCYQGNTFYRNGPGTKGGLVGKILGGFSGLGASNRIEDAFEELKTQFTKGDVTIDIIGYSRGAAIARMFIEKIRLDYWQLHDGQNYLSSPPEIRFLGLFDTVASFGLPWTNDEHDFTPEIPAFVNNTFHAMALDEPRETFGIERCIGNRATITEVWFRGSHGDIGGNAVLENRGKYKTNRARSDISLNWLASKAKACCLPMSDDPAKGISSTAPITSKEMFVEIGDSGTVSRQIHIGDLVHYTVEDCDLIKGIDGRSLRRINAPTRIEDKFREQELKVTHWIPVSNPIATSETNTLILELNSPQLIELSSKRYPFDTQPARSWRAWLDIWQLGNIQFDEERLDEFWAVSPKDKALAWDMMVELATRISTQKLADNEGDEVTALTSVFNLFQNFRDFLHTHGPEAANVALLINYYLNTFVRPFTAKWHKHKECGELTHSNKEMLSIFRQELKELQTLLVKLKKALSVTIGTSLD